MLGLTSCVFLLSFLFYRTLYISHTFTLILPFFAFRLPAYGET